MKHLLHECHTCSVRLRQEMDGWLQQSMLLDPPGPNGGGEDEANYALAWFPHYLITGNSAVLDHFNQLKIALAGWVERECFHGYEPEAEAHHGPEPFLLFLPRYIGLVPDDQQAIRLLEDAAEHIGNWVPEIPAWYDYDRDVFVGYFIGTRNVHNDATSAYELAEHFRFIHIALAAYRVTGQERYLTWSLRYGRRRAEKLIASGSPMPLLWDLDGRGLSEEEVVARGLQRLAAGSAYHVPGNPLNGIENLLASGAIYALGDLYLHSGEAIFQEAARRIIEPIVNTLLDPYNDPAAAALSYYRWVFQDTSFDSLIREQVQRFPETPPSEWVLMMPQETRIRQAGVGRRHDMVYWGEWLANDMVKPIQEPSPASWTLAYQVTGEPRFALRALQGAATRLAIARRGLRGGREHADMGSAVCSVAAGHGRNWGQGAVTACYGPLLLGTRDLQSQVTPAIEVKHGESRRHLPEDLLALVRPGIQSQNEVIFYNGGNTLLSFAWRGVNGKDRTWQILELEPREAVTLHFLERRDK